MTLLQAKELESLLAAYWVAKKKNKNLEQMVVLLAQIILREFREASQEDIDLPDRP